MPDVSPAAGTPAETGAAAAPAVAAPGTGSAGERARIYLPEPCFTHGQLYVAASRVGLPEHLRFAVPIDKDTGTFRTCNVVFREALPS